FMALIVAGYGYNLAGWSSLSTAQGFMAATVVAVTLALGVLLHELAHAAVGSAQGLTVRSISMTVWGGQTSMTTGSPVTSILVSLAGPLVNFLVAAACQLTWLLTDSADFLGFLLAAQVNVAIGVFNLLPAYPLDGGHALEAALVHIIGSRSVATRITAYTGLSLIALEAALVIYLGVWRSPVVLVAAVALAYFLWSGTSHYLRMLSQEKSPKNPLTAAALLHSVQLIPSSYRIDDAYRGWDGSSYLLLRDQGSEDAVGAVEPATLVASAQTLEEQPLMAIAQPLAPYSMRAQAAQIDVMDYYNGYRYHQLPEELRSVGPIWQVQDRGQTVGVVAHHDITALLNRVVSER
ncbi:MAG: site-2 protease family protein, partial [Rothia sp. (in: high G+C Gram-positive bacteria)]|nr:site-2 protease family protein [Rothia sp. (in: high G+C Gram-positive bacteria)]